MENPKKMDDDWGYTRFHGHLHIPVGGLKSLAFMVNKGELVDVVMNVEMTGFLRVMTMSWDARQVKVMLK